ncbi:MAG: hypothetical protein RLZZ216_1238 [Cyanobacteriota bacterium]|jgi:hypothetical protein
MPSWEQSSGVVSQEMLVPSGELAWLVFRLIS